MVNVPLCKDCRHFRFNQYGYRPAKCERPLAHETDPVFGAPIKTVNQYPSRERSGQVTWTGRLKCGPEGRFFAPLEYVKVAGNHTKYGKVDG